MNTKMLSILVVVSGALILTSCDEPDDKHPIVGTWETTDPTGWEDVDISRYLPPHTDWSFDATWVFNKDGSYRQDFHSGAMGGSGAGTDFGIYNLLSDSIMTLHRTEYDTLGIVLNDAWGDSLSIVLIDSRLVTTRVISSVPFTLGDQSFYWQRMD
ncbi:hypothetical protein ACFL6E_00070 [Candidatus Neomarinimicrobiota bacterium]